MFPEDLRNIFHTAFLLLLWVIGLSSLYGIFLFFGWIASFPQEEIEFYVRLGMYTLIGVFVLIAVFGITLDIRRESIRKAAIRERNQAERARRENNGR